MTATRGEWGELLAPGLRKVFFETYEAYPDQYQLFLNVQSTDKAEEHDYDVGGFGLVPEKREGQSILYDDLIPGRKTTYVPVTRAKGFRVTKEMVDDELYGVIKKKSQALARSVKITVNQHAASMLDRAFNPSYVGADGKPLCATDHPLLGGGVCSNALATPADLSTTSAKEALILLANTVDERGFKCMLKAKKILVPAELEFEATEIFKSTLLANVADNNINSLRDRVTIEVINYLTDPDAWFIQASDHEMNFIWREKPLFEDQKDFDTKDWLYSVWMRFTYGWSNWRGIVGTPGAS